MTSGCLWALGWISCSLEPPTVSEPQDQRSKTRSPRPEPPRPEPPRPESPRPEPPNPEPPRSKLLGRYCPRDLPAQVKISVPNLFANSFDRPSLSCEIPAVAAVAGGDLGWQPWRASERRADLRNKGNTSTKSIVICVSSPGSGMR